MSYLVIEDKVKIHDCGVNTRIYTDITIHAETVQSKTLWYEVDRKYKKYLYKDRIDMFLVAILPYCMINGHDIFVSDRTGVSADLLYQLTKILIPSLKEARPFREIRIDAAPIYDGLEKGEGIGTGASRGVDSFYTILSNMDGLFPLTHLTLFNVQGYGDYGGNAARKNFKREVEKAWKVCEELNKEWGTQLSLVTVDSNIQEELPVAIDCAGTLRDTGAILLLRQLFKIYYFAADTKLDTFRVEAAGRFSSPWLYYCLCTENFRIQLFGADIDRIDKVKYISEFPVTYDNLRVCRGPFLFGRRGMEYQYEKNCTCNCDKCRHTVMELIVAGKLEKYKNSFDLVAVQKKYKEFLAEVISKKNELFYKDIYQRLCEQGRMDETIEEEVRLENQNNQHASPNHDAKIDELMKYFTERESSESLAEQLVNRGYHTIAIYGMGRLGRRLYEEVSDMVVYEIDRNKEMVYGNVPIKNLDEEIYPVDLVVITAVWGMENIREALLDKIKCEVMTLDELFQKIK